MKNIIKFFTVACAGLQAIAATGQIMTVSGAIEPEKMGVTLIHEHVMVDWIGADSTGYHRWNRNEIVQRALPYLKEAKRNGVNTFFDCTPAYLGRDPQILKTLSDKSGIYIVTNTGYYGSGNNKFVPSHALKASAEELARDWIREYKNGIDSTGIKPGFVKISVEREDTLSEMHRKLIKAAALTHLATGLSIVSHTGTDGPAMEQLRELKDMGVSPKAFIWTHAQNGTMEGYLRAAEQGAWISLDNVNDEPERIAWFVSTLSTLKVKNIMDHVLISHDAGWYDVGTPNGGEYKGYTDIFTKLIPELKKNGFTQKDLNLLLEENPKKAFSIGIRKL